MKNLLLFSTFVLTTAVAFAQLTVKPVTGPGAADSYIYVNDQVLFVKNEINLTRNTSGPTNTEASIYLRNNAQLIQEGATSNNTGDGQLSVQQNTPFTNAYAYYLWCSPIGNTSLTAGNQNFGVGHVYEPLPSTSITAAQLALTTTGRDGTDTPMRISTRWLYTFETPGTEVESNYKRMNSGNNAPPGFGFTMKGVGLSTPGGDQVYEFRGRPNSGEFTIPVGPSLMTLTGNPYPSAIDLNKLFYDPENAALGTFWYYDEDRSVASHLYSQKPFGYGVYTIGPEDSDGNPYDGNNLGTYAAAPFSIYTSGGGQTGTGNSSSNSDDNKRFAPIGQGIMFVGDAVGNVKIKNSYRLFFREDTTGSIFQRPENESNTDANASQDPTFSSIAETNLVDNRTPLMRLWSVFDDAVTREMVIAFYDQATDGYDRGLDGLSAQDLKTDAYFPIGNDNERKPYVINGIKFEENKQIPIAFKLNKATGIRLLVKEEINKPYRHAYLFDSQENTYQNLSVTGSRPSTLNLPAGVYDNRFFIVFRSPNVKRDAPQEEVIAKNIVMENVTFFQNNPSQQLEIKNPEGYVIKSASVFDMSGKLVIAEKNLGSNTKYSFYTGNLSDGVYLVKLMTADDVAIDYKAIVHNK